MSRIGKLPVHLPAGVTVTFENGLLTVKGLKEGSTHASISAGSQTQSFNITVRKSANGNGWL